MPNQKFMDPEFLRGSQPCDRTCWARFPRFKPLPYGYQDPMRPKKIRITYNQSPPLFPEKTLTLESQIPKLGPFPPQRSLSCGTLSSRSLSSAGGSVIPGMQQSESMGNLIQLAYPEVRNAGYPSGMVQSSFGNSSYFVTN